MATVWIVFKGEFSEIPLLATVAVSLKRMGHVVGVLCGTIDEQLCQRLVDLEIAVIYKEPNFRGPSKSLLRKAQNWYAFRRFVVGRRNYFSKNAYFWLASADTAICLLGAVSLQMCLLHLHELYDRQKVYRFLLKFIAKAVRVVVCPESHRAAIFAAWFKLKNTPVVIQNMPLHDVAGVTSVLVEMQKERILKVAKGRKIAIYQGHIAADRDLSFFAKAFNLLTDQWLFLILGKCHDQSVNNLSRVCPNILHIEHLPSPQHLQITALAQLGLITYSRDSLNNLYCAPNKVWEYGQFGIPFIANRTTAMEEICDRYQSGICIDETAPAVISAVMHLEASYAEYSKRAKMMFESVKISEKIKEAVMHLQTSEAPAQLKVF